MIRHVLAVTACLSSTMMSAPATAQTASAGPPVAAAPVVAAVPADDMRIMAALTGRKMAGRPVNGPYATADKLLLLARNSNGEPIVATSLAFPARQSLPAPPQGTLAIIRLHQTSETVVPGPTADDIAFVAANKVPLYVIGEWARPAPMWEVVFLDKKVRFRTIGEIGEIGPWRD